MILEAAKKSWHSALPYTRNGETPLDPPIPPARTHPIQMQSEEMEMTDLDEPTMCSSLALVHVEDSKLRSNSSSSTSSDPNETVCYGCGGLIFDRYIMKVMDQSYHEACLTCCACRQNLVNHTTCFVKQNQLYCQQDHSILFGKSCKRCKVMLLSTDFVYKCGPYTYHLGCFSCCCCHSAFNKGDELYFYQNEIFCQQDYHHVIRTEVPGDSMPNIYDDMNDGSRKTPKRPRTILNSQQRRQFKAAFEKSAKPCRKVREQLAKETGLNVRVVQVWFQNQRAKMKKMVRKEENGDASKRTTNSEERSIEEQRSSDEEELDSDDMDSDKKSLEDLSNPIQKLYNMTSSHIYFPYAANV